MFVEKVNEKQINLVKYKRNIAQEVIDQFNEIGAVLCKVNYKDAGYSSAKVCCSCIQTRLSKIKNHQIKVFRRKEEVFLMRL